jgi:hypothetical protein
MIEEIRSSETSFHTPQHGIRHNSKPRRPQVAYISFKIYRQIFSWRTSSLWCVTGLPFLPLIFLERCAAQIEHNLDDHIWKQLSSTEINTATVQLKFFNPPTQFSESQTGKMPLGYRVRVSVEARTFSCPCSSERDWGKRGSFPGENAVGP